MIYFGISIDFVYAQLNVKTLLFLPIQFSSVQFQCEKTVVFQVIQFSISMQFGSI